jgi:hypothetical protein
MLMVNCISIAYHPGFLRLGNTQAQFEILTLNMLGCVVVDKSYKMYAPSI